MTYYLGQIGLTVALAGTIAHRAGLTLAAVGLGRHPGPDRWSAYSRAWSVGISSALGFCAASVTVWALTALPAVPTPPGGFEVNHIHDYPGMIVSSLHAGIVEEILCVALVVTALEAARRPTWHIYATGLVMRVAIHLTYGITAPAAAIFAALNIRLLRRSRRLLPLIAAHVVIDLGAVIKMLGGPLALPVIVAAVIAVDAVLRTRAAQDQPAIDVEQDTAR